MEEYLERKESNMRKANLTAVLVAVLLALTGCSIENASRQPAPSSPTSHVNMVSTTSPTSHAGTEPTTTTPSRKVAPTATSEPILPEEEPSGVGSHWRGALPPRGSVVYSFDTPKGFGLVKSFKGTRFYLSSDGGALVASNGVVQLLDSEMPSARLVVCVPIIVMPQDKSDSGIQEESVLLARGKTPALLRWETIHCEAGIFVAATWRAEDESFSARYEGPLAHFEGIKKALETMSVRKVTPK